MEENVKNLAGAVLVGKSNDDFLLFCKEVLRQYKIEPVICPDVYCAVSKLANSPETVLVTGRLSQLAKENGRLIDIAKSHGHVCCCLKDNVVVTDKGIDHLISEPNEFLEVVKNLKGQGTFQSVQTGKNFYTTNDLGKNEIIEQDDFGMKNGRKFNFNKLDFAPSKAEIDALLGGMDI